MKTEMLELTEAGLEQLTRALRDEGARVIAPAAASDAASGGAATDYREVESASEIVFDGPLPRFSLKEFFLPPTEALLRWRQEKGGVSLIPVPADYPKTVVIGAYPCDVAALPVLDRVMSWDYEDGPWFGRRKATTLIARACRGEDHSCFCEAVGLSPDSGRGADLLLVPTGAGKKDHLVKVLSPAGEELVGAHKGLFEAASDTSQADAFTKAASQRVAQNLSVDPATIRAWLEASFEDDLWAELSDRCHGCGACASVCPTCHCFDIVDEPDGLLGGARRRNWDTCQTALFTLHGSGHNPRPTQTGRYRQRVMHKFAIYPKRFEEILCTGCGRCARACAAGMDISEILRRIGETASEEKRESASVGGKR